MFTVDSLLQVQLSCWDPGKLMPRRIPQKVHLPFLRGDSGRWDVVPSVLFSGKGGSQQKHGRETQVVGGFIFSPVLEDGWLIV